MVAAPTHTEHSRAITRSSSIALATVQICNGAEDTVAPEPFQRWYTSVRVHRGRRTGWLCCQRRVSSQCARRLLVLQQEIWLTQKCSSCTNKAETFSHGACHRVKVVHTTKEGDMSGGWSCTRCVDSRQDLPCARSKIPLTKGVVVQHKPAKQLQASKNKRRARAPLQTIRAPPTMSHHTRTPATS